MPKPAPCSLELASPYPLPPVFTGGTGGAAYPPPACALPYAPGLAFGTCGTAPPPCGAPARGSPYGVGVCPHPPALCGGACCHPPPPYRHHTRASRCTVSLSIFPVARVLTPSPTSRARRTRRRARTPLMRTMRIHRTRPSPRVSRVSRAVVLAHLLRRRLLPSTTASTGRLHRARRPCDARRSRVGSFLFAREYTRFYIV